MASRARRGAEINRFPMPLKRRRVSFALRIVFADIDLVKVEKSSEFPHVRLAIDVGTSNLKMAFYIHEEENFEPEAIDLRTIKFRAKTSAPMRLVIEENGSLHWGFDANQLIERCEMRFRSIDYVKLALWADHTELGKQALTQIHALGRSLHGILERESAFTGFPSLATTCI